MNQKFLNFCRTTYHKYEFLQPFLSFIDRKFIFKTRFSGGGMKTEHALPWDDEFNSKKFLQSNNDLRNFRFTKNIANSGEKTADDGAWRHWIVSFATQYAIEFSKQQTSYNFVECGTADGITSFFTLREISNNSKIREKFSMHLYDVWGIMKKESLTEKETRQHGYENLDINITKNNLKEFKNDVIFHSGYIPNSFEVEPLSPKSIIYLHIDLNSSKPTLDALEYFYPKLESHGIILFDDYGWAGYEETKDIVDVFFSKKSGILLKLPTGQAIFFKN
mgnify:FL=1